MSFEGDPRLILSASGSRLQFVGGQPLMDKGVENLALISLFTSPGWAGNLLIKEDIGSDFENAAKQPITLSALNDIRDAAERALKTAAFGDVTVEVTNPTSDRLDVFIIIDPPAENPQQLQLTRNGQNWIFQTIDPAYKKVN